MAAGRRVSRLTSMGLRPIRSFRNSASFAGGRGLATALQAHHEDGHRRLVAQIDRSGFAAEFRGNFLVKNADECLSRRQAAIDFRADGTLLHPGDEITHDRHSHVGLDQGPPHVPDSVLDVLVGQAPPASHPVGDLTQSAAQIRKQLPAPGIRRSDPVQIGQFDAF